METVESHKSLPSNTCSLSTANSNVSSLLQHSSGRGKARRGADQPRTHVSSQVIPSGFGSDVRELRGLIEKTGGADELRELIGQLGGLIGKYGAGGGWGAY